MARPVTVGGVPSGRPPATTLSSLSVPTASDGLQRRRRTGRRSADQRGREETGLDRAGVPSDPRDEGPAGELAPLGVVAVDRRDRQAGRAGGPGGVVTDDPTPPRARGN